MIGSRGRISDERFWMFIFGKIFSKLTWHCLGGLGIGLLAAVLISLSFFRWMESDDNSALASAYAIRFPEDEELLRKLSDEILEGTNVAGEETELMNIAPAAGSETIAAEAEVFGH